MIVQIHMELRKLNKKVLNLSFFIKNCKEILYFHLQSLEKINSFLHLNS